MYVASVVQGSQADKHGLARGWVLERINETPVAGLTQEEMLEKLAGRPQTLSLVPPPQPTPFSFDASPTGMRLRFDVTASDATSEGCVSVVVVEQILEGSQAERLGLAAGWELVAIDSHSIADKDEPTLMALLARRPATFHLCPPPNEALATGEGHVRAEGSHSGWDSELAKAREATFHFVSPAVDAERLEGTSARLQRIAARLKS